MLTVAKERRPKWPDDPRDIPMYTVSEVASYLRMSPSTLADWMSPRRNHGRKSENFGPLIQPYGDLGLDEGRLSFYNVIEAHVLLAALRHHKIPILSVRRALSWVQKIMPSRHPLAEYTFQTKGKHLFVSKLEGREEPRETIDASIGGQSIILGVLDRYLARIHRDQAGIAERLFPIVPGSQGDAEPVMMDINFASGKLVVADTGVLASVLHGRYKAGHSIEKLARDYHLSPDRIKGAIDYLEIAA